MQPRISRVLEGVRSSSFGWKGYLGRSLSVGGLYFGVGPVFSVAIFWVGPFLGLTITCHK